MELSEPSDDNQAGTPALNSEWCFNEGCSNGDSCSPNEIGKYCNNYQVDIDAYWVHANNQQQAHRRA